MRDIFLEVASPPPHHVGYCKRVTTQLTLGAARNCHSATPPLRHSATPPLRHSINQSERKNAGVGSATEGLKFGSSGIYFPSCRYFPPLLAEWEGPRYSTPFHSHTLPHSTTFTTVSLVNPFIPTNKYASQSQGKACFLFFRRRRRSAHFLRFSLLMQIYASAISF